MINQPMIPLFYPVRTSEMEQAALKAIRSGQIASGPVVDQFERAFGQYVGCQNVVTTSDMTSAIVIALRLAGVQTGHEVAAIAFSCLSTNSAIAMVGAQPVWVDVDPVSMSLCPNDLVRKLTSNTKAVLLYHVAGYPADVAAISKVCKERGIALIQDCNNALGARFDGQPVGAVGDFTVYSFYPNRQINGLEGGALVCPDEKTARHARRLRRFGIEYANFRDERGEISATSDVPEIGLSAPFSQLNASVAISQLDTLGERQSRTHDNAKILSSLLDRVDGIKLVEALPAATPAYWCFLIHSERRDKLLNALKCKGVACSVMHQRNDIYTGFNGRGNGLPGTSYVMDHLLALPCGWWLDETQIHQVAESVVLESASIC